MDGEKFNLDKPACRHHKYRGDVRHPRLTGYKRNHAGGSLMIWSAFQARGKSKIYSVASKMNAERIVYHARNICGDN